VIDFSFTEIAAITRGTWLAPPLNAAHPTDGETSFLSGVGIDSREDLRGRIFFAIRGEQHDGNDYIRAAAGAGAAMMVVERTSADIGEINVPVLRVESTRRALADLARAHRARLCRTKVIGITGSVGKTTTRALLDGILRSRLRGTASIKSFNNDIGVPLTILSASPQDDYLIIEIGTNAPGEIDALASIAQPHIAIITAIGCSHLEGLGSIAGVIDEKGAILEHVPDGGLCIIPADVPALAERSQRTRTIRFGETPSADLRLASCRVAADATEFITHDGARFRINLPGRHNAVNAMIAVAAARELGLDDNSIRAALASVHPPPMRMQRVDLHGITFWHDAYNANPESMRAALETFRELTPNAPRRILFLGDMLELGRASHDLHAELGERIASLHAHTPISHLVLLGSFAGAIRSGIGSAVPDESISLHAHLDDEALRAVRDLLLPGDHILLKASRGIGLERIIAFLETSAPEQRVVESVF